MTCWVKWFFDQVKGEKKSLLEKNFSYSFNSNTRKGHYYCTLTEVLGRLSLGVNIYTYQPRRAEQT